MAINFSIIKTKDPMKCIIIEDEPASRSILEKYILDCPQLELLDVFPDAMVAGESLLKLEVDLIFLDINMPKISGMQFYKSLMDPPLVIFTTAYPQYAVEGFEVNAVDYLLKPFPFERFLKAVNKAFDQLEETKERGTAHIMFTVNKKIYRILIEEIYHLEALGDYVKVFYQKEMLVVHDTLQNILGRLPGHLFFRVHRSHAIALDRLNLIEGNRIDVNGKQIPVSQKYRTELLNRIRGDDA